MLPGGFLLFLSVSRSSSLQEGLRGGASVLVLAASSVEGLPGTESPVPLLLGPRLGASPLGRLQGSSPRSPAQGGASRSTPHSLPPHRGCAPPQGSAASALLLSPSPASWLCPAGDGFRFTSDLSLLTSNKLSFVRTFFFFGNLTFLVLQCPVLAKWMWGLVCCPWIMKVGS